MVMFGEVMISCDSEFTKDDFGSRSQFVIIPQNFTLCFIELRHF